MTDGASHDITSERAIELAVVMVDPTDAYARRLTERTLEVFTEFTRQRSLSPKQRQWVADEAMRLGLIDEQALNLWSNKSPAEQARIRGREVPTPAVLSDDARKAALLIPPHKRRP